MNIILNVTKVRYYSLLKSALRIRLIRSGSWDPHLGKVDLDPQSHLSGIVDLDPRIHLWK